MDIILNTPMCDYMTLTTFDPNAAKQARQWLFTSGVAGELVREGAKQMQYTGYQFENGFLGAGEQAGMMHNMLRVTGVNAHYALRQLVGTLDCSAWAARRLDFQITIKQPMGWSARLFADKVYKSDTRGRVVQLIENLESGLDTVYIGSRTSYRFARYYVKSASGGLLLRYEVELKRERAETLYGQICASGRVYPSAAQSLRDFQDGYTETNTAKLFAAQLKADGDVPMASEIVKGERATEDWLRSVILKSLINYASRGDGEYSQACGWVAAASGRLKMMRTENESEID